MGVLGVALMWFISHLSPETLGTCHEVALNLGPEPSVRECQPYSTADFAVPLAVLAFLFLGGEGDLKFSIPGLGTFERTRSAKRAARTLRTTGLTISLDRRARELQELIERNEPVEPEDPRSG